jgi:hypothetical protein
MNAPNSEPATLFDVELHVGRMNEAELSLGVQAMELAIALHRGASIGARIDDGNAVEDSSVANRTCLERLDHEPLVRLYLAYLFPTHVATVATMGPTDKFRAEGDMRRSWARGAVPPTAERRAGLAGASNARSSVI